MSDTQKFDELVGKEFDFYGAAENQFRLGDTTWLAVEDEDDGYRSYLGSVEIPLATTVLFNQPIARVRLEEHDSAYKLVDTQDEHVWLEFGTDNSDDYYPCFYFSYTPKKPNP
jgi:hypothetical protein